MLKVFTVLLIIASIVMIIVSLLTETKEGPDVLYGQTSNAFGQSAHKTKDAMLASVMIIASCVFVVSLLGLIALN